MAAGASEAVLNPQRLRALDATALLDETEAPAYDRLTRMAAHAARAPHAAVTLVAADRQVVLSHASAAVHGIGQPPRVMELRHAFCRFVVETESPLVIPDTLRDGRFAAEPPVTELGIRSYAGFPLRTPDHDVLGTLCVVDTRPRRWKDATLKVLENLAHAAEQDVALRLERRRLASVADVLQRVLREANGLVVITTDDEGLVTSFSAGAEAVLGYDAGEVVGVMRLPELLDSTIPLPERAHTPYDVVVRHRDGTARVLSLTMSRSPHGHAEDSVLVVGTDITSRRRREDALQAALQAETAAKVTLERLDDAKSAFIADASHELRTPITSILGYTELLEDGGDNLRPAQADALSRIKRNGERMRTVVDDLLSLSRIDAGEQQLRREPLAAGDLVTRALVSVEPMLDGRDLEIEVSLEDVTVHVDPTPFEQVVANLVSNAVKFTPDGGTVRVVTFDDGESACLRVSDTGMGIPPKEQASVFDRFVRTDAARRQAIPGTGLGLSIAKTVVEAHGGTIRLESTPGRGTTVEVRLPHRARP